jgi:hypothetical protein
MPDVRSDLLEAVGPVITAPGEHLHLVARNTGAQRLIQRSIEFIGDNIPPPWGPRIEFVFREIGGLIWLQSRF